MTEDKARKSAIRSRMAKTGGVLPDRRNRVLLALTLALTALSACSKNSEAAEPAQPPAPKPSRAPGLIFCPMPSR